MTPTEAIDADVWRPFTAAYPALDAALALSTCSADYVHAGGSQPAAQGRSEYAQAFQAFFDAVRTAGDAVEIEFRFTERLHGADVAFERGIFRIDVQPSDGEPRARYGRFAVFLRVEDGRWRILSDHDEPGGTADEFAAATPHG